MRKYKLPTLIHLDLQKIRFLVIAFSHVEGNELKLHIFLQETGYDPAHGSREWRAVHFYWSCHWICNPNLGVSELFLSFFLVSSVLLSFRPFKSLLNLPYPLLKSRSFIGPTTNRKVEAKKYSGRCWWLSFLH